MQAVKRRLLPFVALAATLTLVAGCDSASTEEPQSAQSAQPPPATPQSDVPVNNSDFQPVAAPAGAGPADDDIPF